MKSIKDVTRLSRLELKDIERLIRKNVTKKQRNIIKRKKLNARKVRPLTLKPGLRLLNETLILRLPGLK